MCLIPAPTASFSMDHLTTYSNATRCAASWIQLGGLGIDECADVTSLLIDLTCFIYWNRSDPDGLVMEEMDLIEVTLEALVGIIQHPYTSRFKNHILKFSANVLSKFDKILEAERNQEETNKELVASLYGLITAVGESQSEVFIENLSNPNPEEKSISFQLLNSILKCTDLPGSYPVDELCSTFTFGFWFTLQDEIISMNAARCAQLLLIVKPYYRHLVCILLRKGMYPYDDNWSQEDQELFRCHRQDIADTFVHCYIVLNIEMLDILNTKLDEALRKTDEHGASRTIRWNELESVLHAYGAVAEGIESENLYIPKLMNTLGDIPFNEMNVKLMATALETIGDYSEWFAHHPYLLDRVFPLILSNLGNTDVAMSVTIAVKDLTFNCQKFLGPFADHILLTSQNILSNGNLKLAERRRLMCIVGQVLSTLPIDKIMNYLNVIISPSLEELNKLVNEEPSPSVNNSLMTRLKLVSALFSSLYIENKEAGQEQPVLVVMQKTMPLFQMIAEKHRWSIDIIEDLSLVYKTGITTLKEDCKSLIPEIFRFILTVYTECPQSSIITVAKTMLILFNSEEEFLSVNQQLLREIVRTTLQMCSQYSTSNQLSEKTEVLEDFFMMLTVLTKKCPRLVATCGIDSSAIFQCAILCLIVPEVPTLKQISHYLVQFIFTSRETSQAEVVQAYGESLLLRILMNLGNTAPRSSVDILSDIILALNRKYCDDLSRWLNSLMSQEGFPSPRISARQKEIFIKTVMESKTNKRKLAECVLTFTLTCRGIMKDD
ncbi:importin-13-like protein cdm isoform X2 [Leptinotarsa decemlineata]